MCRSAFLYVLFECAWIIKGQMLTMRIEPSAVNAHSTIGRIDTHLSHVNLYQCVTECSMDPRCVMIGYSEYYETCQFYSVDLTDFTSGLISQSSTEMYKAICGLLGYTNIRTLNRCIKRHTEMLTWHEARDACQAEGGDLLTLDSEAVKQYLSDTLLNIQGVSYWIAGARNNVTTSWQWVSTAQEVTVDSGSLFWAFGEPSVGECMELYDLNFHLRFKASNCSAETKFICEKELV